ncbi:MAG: tripartite tricarboxylate transporter substrate-binding protein, partial [Burkholderiales bacterium]
PGGPNDLVVRPVAQKLPEVLGQPFVVDYRAGANGIIGTELVAKSAPDTPTFAETRFPDVQVDSRYGMIGPAAMPAAIIARLQAAIAKALGTSEVHERYAALGLEPSAMTAQEYGAYLRDDVVRWRKVVAAAKLSPQ